MNGAGFSSLQQEWRPFAPANYSRARGVSDGAADKNVRAPDHDGYAYRSLLASFQDALGFVYR